MCRAGHGASARTGLCFLLYNSRGEKNDAPSFPEKRISRISSFSAKKKEAPQSLSFILIIR